MLLSVLLGLAACSSSSAPAAPDAGPGPEAYLYMAPPAGPPPAGLDAATWATHHHDDLLPFWLMDAAKGTPVGNFPTYRTMTGVASTLNTARKPRMMGRQIFTYSIGYLLTGDESLLDLARAGNSFLLAHARDTAHGGWYADLDSAGNPAGTGDKFAQDMAYDVMGPAAFFYVTADADSEAAVLAARDLLFDPAHYWDTSNGRIKDGLTSDFSAEAYMGSRGSWELVAQLDPITAFLLLVQPSLTDPARRDQALGDLRTLALRIHDSFWKDGIFWGSTGAIGTYGSNHTDFGHILKSYWALLQIDKRLADRPLQAFLADKAKATLTLAFDADFGRWAKQPVTQTSVSFGADWWAYAEADQLCATLSLHDPSWIATVAQTAPNFIHDFVDRTHDPAREVIPTIDRRGAWAYAWPSYDTAKANEWKNGFHAAEHALVMKLFAHWLAATPAPLYFAFPAAQADALARLRRPYTFGGDVATVEDLGPLTGDPTRHKVRVSFTGLR